MNTLIVIKTQHYAAASLGILFNKKLKIELTNEFLVLPRLSIEALDQVDHVNTVESIAVKQGSHEKEAL